MPTNRAWSYPFLKIYNTGIVDMNVASVRSKMMAIPAVRRYSSSSPRNFGTSLRPLWVTSSYLQCEQPQTPFKRGGGPIWSLPHCRRRFFSTQQPSQHLPHDLGGQPDAYGDILSPQGHEDYDRLSQWEQECHALIAILGSKSIVKTDQLRRTIEDLTPAQYESWTYYEKWAAAVTSILLNNQTISQDELQMALFGETLKLEAAANQFQAGDSVRVRPYLQGVEWKRPHIRVPGYIYGVCGSVIDVCGTFGDPSYLGFGIPAPKVWLYRVRFSMKDLWPEQTSSTDEISVEVYEHWLEPSTSNQGHGYEHVSLLNHDSDGRDCQHHDHHHHHHHHDGEEDHSHDPRPDVERRAVALEGPPRPGKELFRALTTILVDKDIVSYSEIRKMTDALENAGRQLHGASLVVEAWMNPDFKDQLVDDAVTAARTIGIETANPNAPTVLSVVANDPKVHNLVVCTLCSCYPSGLLGIAPSWYKSAEYRSRAVREPRSVLKEFGTDIPDDKVVRIHDSTADHRYLVLPERPEGTDGWSREELRRLVTRDSMIGVTVPKH